MNVHTVPNLSEVLNIHMYVTGTILELKKLAEYCVNT